MYRYSCYNSCYIPLPLPFTATAAAHRCSCYLTLQLLQQLPHTAAAAIHRYSCYSAAAYRCSRYLPLQLSRAATSAYIPVQLTIFRYAYSSGTKQRYN